MRKEGEREREREREKREKREKREAREKEEREREREREERERERERERGRERESYISPLLPRALAPSLSPPPPTSRLPAHTRYSERARFQVGPRLADVN